MFTLRKLYIHHLGHWGHLFRNMNNGVEVAGKFTDGHIIAVPGVRGIVAGLLRARCSHQRNRWERSRCGGDGRVALMALKSWGSWLFYSTLWAARLRSRQVPTVSQCASLRFVEHGIAFANDIAKCTWAARLHIFVDLANNITGFLLGLAGNNPTTAHNPFAMLAAVQGS